MEIIGRATLDAPGKTRARFTNRIAEPAADDPLVVDAINDYLKAIAASLLMEQVLAPRFDFTPKDAGPKPGFDYGAGGYKEGETNFGVNDHGQMTRSEARRVGKECVSTRRSRWSPCH